MDILKTLLPDILFLVWFIPFLRCLYLLKNRRISPSAFAIIQLIFIFYIFILVRNAHAEAVPRGSQYDARMQQVVYNPQNVSMINASPGFLTTLIFADDEAVLDAKAGFESAWEVTKDANRVYVRPRPIEQGAPGTDGNTDKVVIAPNSHDWRTNLLVVTTKRVYSLDLNVLDDDNRAKPAYVVSFRYPQDAAAKATEEQAQRQASVMKQTETARTEKALEVSQVPRNWDYVMHVGNYSRQITPDFAWDDGRFTFIGFSPIKKIPSVTMMNAGKEQLVPTSIQRKGSYTVLVVQDLVPNLILRAGNAVVGVDNLGYGKVRAADGNTVSPLVERVEK